MSVQNSNKRFFIGLLIAFILPVSFYFIAKIMSKDKLHLPAHFIVDSVHVSTVNGEKRTDTFYHRVAPIRLTNQLGEKISTDSDLNGKILVFDFFFVSCPSICPRLTTNMSLLQKAFKKGPKMNSNLDTAVHFVSITVNPTNDTFQRLRIYADRYGANHDHWWFLTGNKKDIYNFARNELFVTATQGDGGPEDFIHTEKLILVDRNRLIRGYYNGLDSMDIRRCADDIVLLTLEKEKK